MNRDFDLALRISDSLCRQTDFVKYTVVAGAPPGNSRAAFSRRGGRLIPSDKRHPLRSHLSRCNFGPALTGNLALGCVFFRPNHQRIDADNMLKYVNDAATGILWLDDSQVTSVRAVVEYDRDNPRTLIVLARHDSTLVHKRGVPRDCEQCGVSFVRQSSKDQRLCSEACRLLWQAANNHLRAKREWNPCSRCGAKTSRPGVLLCRTCWVNRMVFTGQHGDSLTTPGAVIRIERMAECP